MPTFITLPDGTRVEGDEVNALLPAGVEVRRIRMRHGEVAFFDGQDRESILVQRGDYPGAGLATDFGDHVEVQFPPPIH
jgi:hypothetical protein